jgi:hypothetical protein
MCAATSPALTAIHVIDLDRKRNATLGHISEHRRVSTPTLSPACRRTH